MGTPPSVPQSGYSAHVVTVRYRSLIRLAEAIRRGRNHEDLFRILSTELAGVVPYDGIVQYDGSANKMNWRICEQCGTPAPNPVADLEKEQTVAWWVHQHQQNQVIAEIGNEAGFPAELDRLRDLGFHSLCALPLTTPHRQLGSLVLVSRQHDAYSEEDVAFLTIVAAQLALAMDDAMKFQQSERNGERLRLLLDLTNRVVSTLDLREVLREIAACIRRVMQVEGAGVTLPDPDTGKLRICAMDFPTSKGMVREGAVVDPSSISVHHVFQTGRPLNLTPEQIQAERPATSEGTRSLCRFPIVGHGRTLGVLTLGTSRENAFLEDDMEFLGQVANQVAIAIENAIGYNRIEELKDQLAQEKVYLEDEIRSELYFEEIIGTSEGLRRILREVETVAPTDSAVLICGDTGTGKELIARALHNLSSRKANAFVKLNCAAIPTGLLESELFGHEKGAFTGAITQRVGRFELANRGTIFLDEVGEIPLELQPKLLRVLQEREFERLGSSRTLRSDARLIAATNRDLEVMVEEQRFRSDLYYRLNVFPIRVPSLRERPEDIPMLVRHFVGQFSRRTQRAIDTIPSDTMEALVGYHWPGNIRELQNVIERAVIVSRGPVLNVPVADLRNRSQVKAKPEKTAASSGENLKEKLGEAERQQILQALEQSNWLVAGPNGAAARLGMKRSTLQFRMRKLGIRISRTGSPA